MKKILFLISALATLLILPACSNHEYREGAIHPPPRSGYERTVNRRTLTRNTVRHRGELRTEEINPTAKPPGRFIPRRQSTAHSPTVERAYPLPPVATEHSEQQTKPSQVPAPSTPVPPTQPTQKGQPTVTAPINPSGDTQERSAIKSSSHPLPVPPKTAEATETENKAPQRTPKQELGSHSTEFDASDENRATNIRQASKTINGTVVEPGASFSYNQTVGPTIERRGYKESIIYVDGEKEKGVGGGVCQVSTTLSIAADNAGMTITERHDHSRPVTYANEGEEAATSYGGIDFKFKNEKSFPVIITSSVQGGTIRVVVSEG